MQYYRPNDEIVPGYILQKFLGRGGFGEVWKASGPGGVEVAIKNINLQGGQGLKEFRSIRLFRKLKHPNLVPLFGFWLKDESGNIITDEVNAENSIFVSQSASEMVIAMGLGEKSLLDRLKECKKVGAKGIPAMELLDYMEDTARAIDYLNGPTHDFGKGPVGIQHCDIKPGNILIVSGAAQVCDFGLARVLAGGQGVSATAAAFTPAYLAPEMIDNKPSNTTDQYSLAITYLELRTGALPFAGNNPSSALAAHLSGNLDLTKLPPAEQKVVRRATAWKPEDRFPTTVEMVQSLRQAVRQSERPRSTNEVNVEESVKPGQELVPGFKLVRLIGKGGYGEVWEAIAPGGKHCALKVIRNLDASQSVQEFRVLELMKALEHPNLMELQAYWLLDPTGQVLSDDPADEQARSAASMLVISTQLAVKNLAQRLKEHQKNGLVGIPAPELLGYIRQTADALDYLNAPQHALADRVLSIQHRDIKPENVLLTRNGIAKVSDFGLAKMVEGTSATIHSQSRGMTVAYAAPEMFKGSVTRWTDQYSLAITYYKLRTGALPFDHNQPLYTLILVHTEGRLDFSLLGEAEQAVLRKATWLEPTERFYSCIEFAAALEAACELRQEIRSTPTGAAAPDYWDKPPTVPSVPQIHLPTPGSFHDSAPRPGAGSGSTPSKPTAPKVPSGPTPKAPTAPAPKSPSGPAPKSGAQPKTGPGPLPAVQTSPAPSMPTGTMPPGTGSTLPPGATVPPTSRPVSLDDEDEEWVSGIEEVPGPKVDLQGRATQAGAQGRQQPPDSLEVSSGFSDDDAEGKLTKTDNPFVTMQPPGDSPPGSGRGGPLSGSTHRGGGGAGSTQVGQTPTRVTVQAEVEEGDSGPTPAWQGDGPAGSSAVAAKPKPQADRRTPGAGLEPEAQSWKSSSGTRPALPGKKRRVKLVVTITLILGVLVLGVGGWLWLKPDPDKQRANILAALEGKEYPAAVARIDDSVLEAGEKQALHERARREWLAMIRSRLDARPEDEATIFTPLNAFSEAFPKQDSEATQLRHDALAFYLPPKIDGLVRAGQFDAAYQKLEEDRAFAATTEGADERRKIDRGWLDRGKGLLAQGKLTAAESDVAALMAKSPDFSDAKKVREQLATSTKAISLSIEAQIKIGKYEEALTELDKKWSDAETLRGTVFTAWYQAAEKLSASKPDEAKAALDKLLKRDPQHKDALALRDTIIRQETQKALHAAAKKTLADLMAGKTPNYKAAAEFLQAKESDILGAAEKSKRLKEVEDAWMGLAKEKKSLAEKQSILLAMKDTFKDSTAVRMEFDRVEAEIARLSAIGDLKTLTEKAFGVLAASNAGDAETMLNTYLENVKGDPARAEEVKKLIPIVKAVRAAETDPMGAALDKLETDVLPKITDPFQKTSVQKAFGRLLETRIVRGIPALADSKPDKTEQLKVWKERLADCNKVGSQAGPWVLACKVECLAELRLASEEVKEEDWTKARSDLSNVRDAGEAAAYVAYARGVGEQAAEQIAAALAEKDPAGSLKSARRKERATSLLWEGTDRLRMPRSIDQPFGSPENAARAYDWLTAAEKLSGKTTDVDRTTVLVLAAWYKKDANDADKKLAGDRAADLIKAKSLEPPFPTLDAYRVHLIHAATRGTEPAPRLEAVDSYTSAVHHARELLKQNPDNEPLVASLYKNILKPAAENPAGTLLGPTPSDETKKRSAALYAELAQMIKADPFPWSGDQVLGSKALDKAADLFGEAFKLDEKQPRYLVAESFLRYDLGSRSPEEMNADADRALALSKKLAPAHTLKAYALLGMSRSEDDYATRIETLKKAKGFCADAEEAFKAGGENADKSDLYRCWSSINLEQGNYEPLKKTRKACIEDAVAFARKATQQNEKNLDAWDALAFSLEDVATVLEEQEKFKEAITAFDRAVASSGFRLDRIRPLVGRARCWLKWAKSTKDGKKFDEAEKQFKAIVGQVQASEKLEAVEAYSHLADIARERGKTADSASNKEKLFREAETWLDKAIQVARSERVKSKIWEEAALAAKCNLLVAEANARKADGGDVKGLIARLEKDNKDLEKLNPVQGILNRFQVAALSDRGSEVLGILKAEPAKVRLQDKIPYFYLLLSRCDYRMAAKPPDIDGVLADAKKAKAEIEPLEPNKTHEAALEGVQGNAKAVKAGVTWNADLHTEAMDHFNKAIKSDPDHPTGWIWRWQHARILFIKPNRTNAETNQMKELMREAKRRLPPNTPREYKEPLLTNYRTIVGDE